jgi:hypothetical protein
MGFLADKERFLAFCPGWGQYFDGKKIIYLLRILIIVF